MPSPMTRRFAAAGVGLLLVMSACGDGDRATGASSPTVTSSPEAFAQVPDTGGPPAPLLPGAVASPEGFKPRMTFDVPEGWFGGGDTSGFGIGKGVNYAEERFDKVGIEVTLLDMPLDEAASRFATIKGIEAGKPTSERIDGHAAIRFAARLTGPPVALQALGADADINEAVTEEFFVDIGSNSLLIRTEVNDAGAEDELSDVLNSLKFD
jgi:hypothetical protein